MKRQKQFDPARDARRRARESAPAIPAKRVIPDKRRKPPKHRDHNWQDASNCWCNTEVSD